MMDQFDFYIIKATSPRKGDLKGAANIQSRTDGWAVYGTRRYPIRHYTASIDYVDVHPSTDVQAIVDARIAAVQAQFPNATVTAEYVARD